jgi:hypothetical protein
MNGQKINLQQKEKKLLEQLIDREIEGRFTLNKVPQTQQAAVVTTLKKLSEKLYQAHIPINYNPQTEEYWVNYADIHANRELRPLAIPQKKDTVLLYLSPGKYGMGTKMFDPLAAEGLQLFLSHNKPILNGEYFSAKSLIKSLDAVIINGGFMPEVPKERTRAQTDLDKIEVLDQLTDAQMSPERLAKEQFILENMRSQGASPEKIQAYMKENYGIISTFDEAAIKVNSLLHTMLGNYKGEVICNTGSEFDSNKRVYKKILEDEITDHLKDINKYRREINSYASKIQNNKFREINAANILDTLDDLQKEVEDHIDLEWLNEDPRKAKQRDEFRKVLDSYVSNKKEQLMNQDFSWNPDYFKDMSQEEIQAFTSLYSQSIKHQIMSSLEIIRTYYGLGWQTKLQIKKQNDALDNNATLLVRTEENKHLMEEKDATLALLGWYDDQPISKAHILDELRLNQRAEEELLTIYVAAAQGYKTKILTDGNYSKININGFAINMKNHEKDIPKGKTLFDMVRKETLERVKDHETIFDIVLTGPGDRGIIEAHRDTNSTYRDAPKLQYQDDARPILSIQTPHIYTSDLIKHAEKSITMKDYESGHVLIHVLSKSGTEHHLDALSVDDLKHIALEKRNLDKKLAQVRSKEERNELKELFKQFITYDPIISIVNLGDLHFADRSGIHQNTSEMRRNASINYIEQNWSAPNVLILGELYDGFQRIKGMDLAHQSKAMTKDMQDVAIANIKNDTNLSPQTKEALLEELIRMQTDGFAKTPMEVQQQEFIKSSTAQYVLHTIKHNGDVIFIDGDHAGRTMQGKSSESLANKNMYELVEVELPSGKKIKAADKMYVGDLAQLTNTVRYNGDLSDNPDNHGLSIYTTHKGGQNELDTIKNMGGDYDTMQSQHNHHVRAQFKGGQSSMVPPGKVQPYDIVDQKGLPSNLEGVTRTLFTDRIESPYKKSVSFDMAFEGAIEDEAFVQRKELRKMLVEQYIPTR